MEHVRANLQRGDRSDVRLESRSDPNSAGNDSLRLVRAEYDVVVDRIAGAGVNAQEMALGRHAGSRDDDRYEGSRRANDQRNASSRAGVAVRSRIVKRDPGSIVVVLHDVLAE